MAGPRDEAGTLGEFELIERYFVRDSSRLRRAGGADAGGAAPRPGRTTGTDRVLIGIGDDAAVIDASGPLAIATDTLVAGTHFPDSFPGDWVGYRVLAVNLSDLAAMGARPRWVTLALTLPHVDHVWLESFSRGFFELANRYGVELVGGDLTRGPLAATVQIVGSVDCAAMLTRSGGRCDDAVYVTGTLGDAAAGLDSFRRRSSPSDSGPRVGLKDRFASCDDAMHARLERRFARPDVRVAEGLALAPLAYAAIDVSDGLVADLGHICARSDCGAIVDVDKVPLSAELRAACTPDQALAHALGGGDDHELCFTAPEDRSEAIQAALRPTGTKLTRIGRLVAGSGVELRRGGEPFEAQARGYAHF